MNNCFELLEKGIYRLCVPFEAIYTSVFILRNEKGTVLLDSANSPEDAQNFVLPALEKAGFTPDYIICSHLHGDHCGGMGALLKAFPQAKAGLMDQNTQYENETCHFIEGEVLFGQYKIISLTGHTKDCLGILDLETKTLISCDSLQQYGLDKYPTYLSEPADYLFTLQRIKALDINRIIFSHDYDPCGYSVSGKENILNCLEVCKNAAKEKYSI